MNHPNISQILSSAYQQYPEKKALTLLFSNQPEQEISYQQLVEGSAYFARTLQEKGIQPGEVVIIILKHSQALVLAFFGSMLSGAVPSIMPFLTEKLLPDHYRSALEALFEITKPAVVMTYQDFLPEVKAASLGTTIREILISEEIFGKNTDNATSKTIDIDFSKLNGTNCQPEEIALLQHSSGTTGLQKGVALSHQAIFNQLESYKKALNYSRQDIVASWLPLYHDMGLIAGFLMPILVGASLVLMSPFDWVRAPYRLLQAISRHRSTFCWLPNFAYNFCAQKIREKDLEGVDLSCIKAFINCSEPMYWNSHRMFFDRFAKYGLQAGALATSYAMAENVFAVTQGGIQSPVILDTIDRQLLIEKQVAHPVKEFQNQDDALRLPTENENLKTLTMLSAGQPIEGTIISIRDDNGNPVKERVIGEIAIKSNCMLTGYFHRPDLTLQAFADGWYLTGDLGYCANNEVFITGRKKDLIIVGGKNIYPQDLERLAGEVDGIYPGRVVAFGVFNEAGGTEDVVILAETTMDEAQIANDPNSQEKIDQISSQIRQRVTQGSDISLRYVQIVHRNWLIKTSSGKIARSANREKYLSQFD
jgi:acyl-CoA synthetase (AMP-forming)/AMP-acid ligase II